MADVQIQQDPGRGSTSWIWAIVVILLVALIAWFVFARGDRAITEDRTGVDVEITTPAPATPAPEPAPPPQTP